MKELLDAKNILDFEDAAVLEEDAMTALEADGEEATALELASIVELDKGLGPAVCEVDRIRDDDEGDRETSSVSACEELANDTPVDEVDRSPLMGSREKLDLTGSSAVLNATVLEEAALVELAVVTTTGGVGVELADELVMLVIVVVVVVVVVDEEVGSGSGSGVGEGLVVAGRPGQASSLNDGSPLHWLLTRD